jgi:hypothetical protein
MEASQLFDLLAVLVVIGVVTYLATRRRRGPRR